MTDKHVDHGHEPTHMNALDDIIGTAIDPKIDFRHATQWIIAARAGEGDIYR